MIKTPPPPLHTQGQSGDIAIIGMACLLPGAPDLQTYWQNILGKVDSVTDPPPEAWPADVFYDPDSHANDRVYCKRGGFLGPIAEFNPLSYGIMPTGIEGGEPDQWLALKVAYDALRDAGYLERLKTHEAERHRTAVILGKGTYLNHGNLNMVQHSLVVEQTIQVLQQLHPDYSVDDLRIVRDELHRKLPPFNAEAAPGLVPNIVAGRIANRLDFMGPTYTVDAACASSLIAVDIALRELREGTCDLALVGGVHVTTPIPILTLFCQLNALSRRQEIRPFDKNADGTILSEGIGMVVLKRRADAERDGDRIYAIIKGVGVASDGKGLGVLAPRTDGQCLALERAYAQLGMNPATIGLIEAHGTGTLAGDMSEVKALASVFGGADGQRRIALGSVKSNIGHAMPAAGIAGLIKAALALYHKVLPPTIHCDEPDPALGIEQTPFYLNTEVRPWIHSDTATPRRAGINAFGFGGINAHVILEEVPVAVEAALPVKQLQWDSELLLIEGENREQLGARLQTLMAYLALEPHVALMNLAYTINRERKGLPYRLAIVTQSLADAAQKLGIAAQRLADPKTHQIRDVKGIYFFAQPLYPEGKIALLFPGEGSQYPHMLADLAITFPEVREAFERIDAIFVGHSRGYLPSDFIFPRPDAPPETTQLLWQIDGAIEAVLTANQALVALLSRLGIKADAVVGHSTGEYSALRAAGIIDASDQAFINHLLELNRMHEKLSHELDVPSATLAAVGASREKVEAIAVQAGGTIYVGMDNCPHQTIIVGEKAPMEGAIKLMQSQGMIYELLPFDRPYHTPLFSPYGDSLRLFLDHLPLSTAKVRAYSCTTAAPYPDDPAGVRAIALDHWISPVRFRETVQAMAQDGVRIFIEAGARGNLTAFVDDILRGQPHLAIPANVQHRSGITQLHHLLGMLSAQGVPVDLDYLYARRQPEVVTVSAESAQQSRQQKPGTMKLTTGWVAMSIPATTSATIQSTQSARSLARQEHPPMSVAVPPALPTAAVTTNTVPPAASPPTAVSIPSPVAPAIVAPTPPLGVPASGSAQVMQAHFHLMEQFLASQQAIMQQYLARSAGQPTLYAQPMAPVVPAPAYAPVAPVVPIVPVAAPPVPPPEVVVPPVVVAATPLPPALSTPAQIQQALLQMVSDRTGYPIEMLGLSANLEADLGIDSIKRVEIMGAFSRETGLFERSEMDRISSLKTLKEIVDFLQRRAGRSSEATTQVSAPVSEAVVRPARLPFPFLRTVRTHIPEQELVALCVIDLAEDLFLHDHTLGRTISAAHPELLALPIVPLTISMEIMAEAAAALFPQLKVVGMRSLRAYRWILIEASQFPLIVVAKQSGANEVSVYLHEADDEQRQHNSLPIMEGTILLAADYPAPPPPLRLEVSAPSRWQPDALYREGMFHGPAFRAVAALERSGANGAVALLQALPTTGLFRSYTDPQFVAEPVILDAAGQVVGFWTLEQLTSGFVVFPYHCAELDFYGPPLRTPETVRCSAQITVTDDGRTLADLDLVDEAEHVRMRLRTWEDKRFDLPRPFYRFLLDHRHATLAEPLVLPIETGHDIALGRVMGFPERFFVNSGEFWGKVLAYVVLNAQERLTWQSLKGPQKRRSDWLLGRVALKETVRRFVRERYQLELCLADIEVVTDAQGRPAVRGAWLARLDAPLAVSLAHSDGAAVAAVGHVQGLGIDMELLQRQDQSFREIAFTAAEQTLISQLVQGEGGDWPLRLWCAKESVGKALGYGLVGGPHSIVAHEVEVRNGIASMTIAGELARRLPEMEAQRITAWTVRAGEMIIALALIP